MKRKAVVTGAGFIGSSIVRKLLESNYQVMVYDDFSGPDASDTAPWCAHVTR